MKYAYATTVLVSFVLTGTALADDCAKACNSARDACLAKPDAKPASCASEYASCLGFDPSEKELHVEPTSCKKGGLEGGQCLPRCEEAKNKCLTRPGSNKSTCSSDYGACKASCSGKTDGKKGNANGNEDNANGNKGNANGNKGAQCLPRCEEKKNECLTTGSNKSTCVSDHDTCKTNCSGKTNEDKGNTEEDKGDAEENKGNTEENKEGECTPTCEETKIRCLAAPGSNKSTCVSECESCKTLCSSNTVGPNVDGQPPVYVAAGGRVQPLMALLAIVAMAVL
ncbi:hypothetical protein G6O67_004186 [Ophiocordyceps sinensis]|uniref:Uncharacterized protein n=2 Tax=Ophiocordyceps sinensis TaxID=72228 RepID=A0A8H4LZI7_9HYPO|nr:hypothetical protein OCS_01720 [Ophiocordyceps sinensis CO18]KAF4507717.1 hypothetical protein G6O67_004186 [Ophiocordyceps sinensis]